LSIKKKKTKERKKERKRKQSAESYRTLCEDDVPTPEACAGCGRVAWNDEKEDAPLDVPPILLEPPCVLGAKLR